MTSDLQYTHAVTLMSCALCILSGRVTFSIAEIIHHTGN